MLELPFTPGESPYRTKGNVYKGLFDSAEARVPGGKKAVLDRIDDPALLRFYEQPFLAASSYDILPIVPWGMVAAKIVGQSYSEFVRGGGAFTAKRDMHGIYRVLLKLASPQAVVKRLPNILLQYFNFGKIDGRFTGDRSYEASATGIPQPILVWLFNVAHGFVPVVLESAGAKNIHFAIHQGMPDRTDEHGTTLFKSSFTVTWE
jgi:hypothetical protein